MHNDFHPPYYNWTATTAKEAEHLLTAVKDLIDAHMVTLVPGDSTQRWKASRDTPVTLSVSLDLSELVGQINDQRTLDASLGGNA